MCKSLPLPKATRPASVCISIAERWCTTSLRITNERDEVIDRTMGVTATDAPALGCLLYDTGLNDRRIGRPLYENVLDGYAQVKFQYPERSQPISGSRLRI